MIDDNDDSNNDGNNDYLLVNKMMMIIIMITISLNQPMAYVSLEHVKGNSSFYIHLYLHRMLLFVILILY
jgi:hypothetical protein